MANNEIMKVAQKAVVGTGSGVVGGLAGYGAGWKAKITNCHTLNGKIHGERLVGGLIGEIDYQSTGLNQVVNCSSDCEVEATGVYAGGLVGYGGAGACRNGSNEPTDFFSFVNSKTSGSIDISAAPGTSGESLHMQSFIGGIVGATCLSFGGNGMKDNTSSMKISVKSRTSVDDRYVSNGANLYDSLFVGGLAGYFNSGVAVPSALNISKSSFSGSISVDDSLSMAYIGGIVGGMMQRMNHTQGGNGHAVLFSGVKAESEGKLIDYKVSAGARPSAAALVANVGGICGLCDELYSMELSDVKGSINVSGNFAGDSLLVGGIAGKAFVSGASYFLMQKAFVNGDILVTANAEQTRVGFLVGSALLNKNYTVKSVYHYGKNDASVAKPFGSLLYLGNEFSDDWMTDVSLTYAVRNAVEESLDESTLSGYKTVAQMQDDEFVNFLKIPFSTEKSRLILPTYTSSVPAEAYKSN